MELCPPKQACWGSNPQHHITRLYLETGSPQKYSSYNEVIKVLCPYKKGEGHVVKAEMGDGSKSPGTPRIAGTQQQPGRPPGADPPSEPPGGGPCDTGISDVSPSRPVDGPLLRQPQQMTGATVTMI